MAFFYPSEIARLVLGYLKEVQCLESWQTFLDECTDLQEHNRLYKAGKFCTTNVNGKSLLDILTEYCALKDAAPENCQNKCSTNTYQVYEVYKTPNKVNENSYARFRINQKIQTQSVVSSSHKSPSAQCFLFRSPTSRPKCQTPRRRLDCQAVDLNFGEAETASKTHTPTSPKHSEGNTATYSNAKNNSNISENERTSSPSHTKSPLNYCMEVLNSPVSDLSSIPNNASSVHSTPNSRLNETSDGLNSQNQELVSKKQNSSTGELWESASSVQSKNLVYQTSEVTTRTENICMSVLEDCCTPQYEADPPPYTRAPLTNSPRIILSHDRSLIPSLTTPMKDSGLWPEEEWSPKRKGTIPRRRLLESPSKSEPYISCDSILENLFASNEALYNDPLVQLLTESINVNLKQKSNFEEFVKKSAENFEEGFERFLNSTSIGNSKDSVDSNFALELSCSKLPDSSCADIEKCASNESEVPDKNVNDLLEEKTPKTNTASSSDSRCASNNDTQLNNQETPVLGSKSPSTADNVTQFSESYSNCVSNSNHNNQESLLDSQKEVNNSSKIESVDALPINGTSDQKTNSPVSPKENESSLACNTDTTDNSGNDLPPSSATDHVQNNSSANADNTEVCVDSSISTTVNNPVEDEEIMKVSNSQPSSSDLNSKNACVDNIQTSVSEVQNVTTSVADLENEEQPVCINLEGNQSVSTANSLTTVQGNNLQSTAASTSIQSAPTSVTSQFPNQPNAILEVPLPSLPAFLVPTLTPDGTIQSTLYQFVMNTPSPFTAPTTGGMCLPTIGNSNQLIMASTPTVSSLATIPAANNSSPLILPSTSTVPSLAAIPNVNSSNQLIATPAPAVPLYDVGNLENATSHTENVEHVLCTPDKTFSLVTQSFDEPVTHNTEKISSLPKSQKVSQKRKSCGGGPVSKLQKQEPKTSSSSARSKRRRNHPKRKPLCLFPSSPLNQQDKTSPKNKNKNLDDNAPVLSTAESPNTSKQSSAFKLFSQITGHCEKDDSPILKHLVSNAIAVSKKNSQLSNTHVRCLDFNLDSASDNKNSKLQVKDTRNKSLASTTSESPVLQRRSPRIQQSKEKKHIRYSRNIESKIIETEEAEKSVSSEIPPVANEGKSVDLGSSMFSTALDVLNYSDDLFNDVRSVELEECESEIVSGSVSEIPSADALDKTAAYKNTEEAEVEVVLVDEDGTNVNPPNNVTSPEKAIATSVENMSEQVLQEKQKPVHAAQITENMSNLFNSKNDGSVISPRKMPDKCKTEIPLDVTVKECNKPNSLSKSDSLATIDQTTEIVVNKSPSKLNRMRTKTLAFTLFGSDLDDLSPEKSSDLACKTSIKNTSPPFADITFNNNNVNASDTIVKKDATENQCGKSTITSPKLSYSSKNHTESCMTAINASASVKKCNLTNDKNKSCAKISPCLDGTEKISEGKKERKGNKSELQLPKNSKTVNQDIGECNEARQQQRNKMPEVLCNINASPKIKNSVSKHKISNKKSPKVSSSKESKLNRSVSIDELNKSDSYNEGKTFKSPSEKANSKNFVDSCENVSPESTEVDKVDTISSISKEAFDSPQTNINELVQSKKPASGDKETLHKTKAFSDSCSSNNLQQECHSKKTDKVLPPPKKRIRPIPVDTSSNESFTAFSPFSAGAFSLEAQSDREQFVHKEHMDVHKRNLKNKAEEKSTEIKDVSASCVTNTTTEAEKLTSNDQLKAPTSPIVSPLSKTPGKIASPTVTFKHPMTNSFWRSGKPKAMAEYYRNAFPNKVGELPISPLSFSNSSCTLDGFSAKRRLLDESSSLSNLEVQQDENDGAGAERNMLENSSTSKTAQENEYEEKNNNTNTEDVQKECEGNRQSATPEKMTNATSQEGNSKDESQKVAAINFDESHPAEKVEDLLTTDDIFLNSNDNPFLNTGRKRKRSDSCYSDSCSTVVDFDADLMTPVKSDDWRKRDVFKTPTPVEKGKLGEVSGSESDSSPEEEVINTCDNKIKNTLKTVPAQLSNINMIDKTDCAAKKLFNPPEAPKNQASEEVSNNPVATKKHKTESNTKNSQSNLVITKKQRIDSAAINFPFKPVTTKKQKKHNVSAVKTSTNVSYQAARKAELSETEYISSLNKGKHNLILLNQELNNLKKAANNLNSNQQETDKIVKETSNNVVTARKQGIDNSAVNVSSKPMTVKRKDALDTRKDSDLVYQTSHKQATKSCGMTSKEKNISPQMLCTFKKERLSMPSLKNERHNLSSLKKDRLSTSSLKKDRGNSTSSSKKSRNSTSSLRKDRDSTSSLKKENHNMPSLRNEKQSISSFEKEKSSVPKKERRSRPTLKIATLKSPYKNTQQNFATDLHPRKSNDKEISHSVLTKNDESVKNVAIFSDKNMQASNPNEPGMKQALKENAASSVADGKSSSPIDSAINHCESTRDMVESDIGRSNEEGSELSIAIAACERELLKSPRYQTDDGFNMQKSWTAKNTESKIENPVEQDEKFAIILNKLNSMDPEKLQSILEKLG